MYVFPAYVNGLREMQSYFFGQTIILFNGEFIYMVKGLQTLVLELIKLRKIFQTLQLYSFTHSIFFVCFPTLKRKEKETFAYNIVHYTKKGLKYSFPPDVFR